MPSGRDVHSAKPFIPPSLDDEALSKLRMTPDREQVEDAMGGDDSDDEVGEGRPSALPGSFPGSSTAASSGELYY